MTNQPQPAPAAAVPTEQSCPGCFGTGYIGDNEAGAPEYECPTCCGTGRHPTPPAEPASAPTNADLLAMAAKRQPPAAWREGDEEELFEPAATAEVKERLTKDDPPGWYVCGDDVVMPIRCLWWTGERLLQADGHWREQYPEWHFCKFHGPLIPATATQALEAAEKLAERETLLKLRNALGFGDGAGEWTIQKTVDLANAYQAEIVEYENELTTLRARLANSAEVVRGPKKLPEGQWEVWEYYDSAKGGEQIGNDQTAIRLPAKGA